MAAERRPRIASVPYQDITAAELPEFLAERQPVVFDMRDAASFARGHIGTAQPVSDERIAELRRARAFDRPLLIYCYHGISSRELATFMVALGFRQVFNLEGGWAAWEALPAATAPAASAPASAQLADWYAANGFGDANPQARVQRGMTPLMLACLYGHEAIVEELLQAEARLDAVNDDGNTALWFACTHGNGDLIRRLIRHGADIDHQNREGATCLIYTASAGWHEVVRTLLDMGARLDPETLDGFTALDCAANLPTLRLLRERSRQQPEARGRLRA